MDKEIDLNIVSTPIFTVAMGAGPRSQLSLAEVLAELQLGTCLEFSALRPHQTHSWHAFLCQLAAAGLHSAGLPVSGPLNARAWENILFGLTNADVEPWCLFVRDLALPAFMQPPVPEGSLSKFKNIAAQPDLLDLLVTAKNHDLKRRRIAQPEPEYWVYALVSLQTSDGFSGRNNYGVARMNGGYGSRSYVSVARIDDWATLFARDVSLLLELRTGLVEEFSFKSEDGHLLLWREGWGGDASYDLADCDPFFIEICRRIRLIPEAQSLCARFTGTLSARVSAAVLKGNVGDPWIPVRRSDGAALTPKSLSYSVIQAVMFGPDYDQSAASRLRVGDGETPIIIARALIRGQGSTEGYYERTVPCPARVGRLLARRGGRDGIGARAKLFIEDVGVCRKKILKPAIAALLQGGPERVNFEDAQADRLVEELEKRVDNIFFDRLFGSVDQDPGIAKVGWERLLHAFAREILDHVIDSSPVPAMRRYRAISRANSMFDACARKNFPDLFAPKGDA